MEHAIIVVVTLVAIVLVFLRYFRRRPSLSPTIYTIDGSPHAIVGNPGDVAIDMIGNKVYVLSKDRTWTISAASKSHL